MSSAFRQYFAPADLRMLERVLDHAGIYNVANDGDRNLRLSGAKFLITRFQAGITDEHGLYAALVENLARMQLFTKSPPEVPMRLVAAGDPLMIGTKNGYRFGGEVTRRRASSDDRLFGSGDYRVSPIGRMMVEGYAVLDPGTRPIAPAGMG